MKSVAVFLLTAVLPVLCFGLKCYSCGPSPRSREALTQSEPCIPVEKDCSTGGDGTYWCYTNELSTISSAKTEPIVSKLKGCILKDPAITLGCKESNNNIPDVGGGVTFQSRNNECYCDKDWCNGGLTGSLQRSAPSTQSTGKIKSISLVSWATTGFLSLAYLMP